MGPNKAMVAASASAPAPIGGIGGVYAGTSSAPGSSVDGLGKIFGAAQALMGLATVFGGTSGRNAANDEAKAMRMEAEQLAREAQAQAEIALEDSRVEAAQKAREVTKFRQKQALTYLKSGVTLEGTPALVLEETRKLGQQEVDALLRRGEAQANYIKMQAETSKVMLKRAAALERSGRNALLGSVLNTGADAATSYVAWKRLSRQNPSPVPTPSPTPAPGPKNSYDDLQPFEDRLR